MSIKFRVYGTPKPQPRPRAFGFKRGDKVLIRAYDPGTAEGWKSQVAEAARPFIPINPIGGPIRLDLVLIMPRPKSHYNRHGLKLDAPTFHTGKPDRDNVEKGILDALTALGMWEDDGQVCQGSVDKIYGERPGAVIVIQHAVMIESGHAIEQGRLL